MLRALVAGIAVVFVLLAVSVFTPSRPALSGSPGCADDGYEDDDTPETATDIEIPFNENGLIVCEFDDDWFSFDLAAGQQIRVDATFSYSFEDDIDLFLYNPLGQQAALAISSSDNETILHTAEMTGKYGLRVNLYITDGAHLPPWSATYGLSIVTEGQATPTPTPPSGTVTPTPTLPAGSIVAEKLIRRVGVQNPSQWPPGEGWEMRVYQNGTCSGTPLMTGETAANGRVEFAVGPGLYSVAEVMQDGWERTNEQACQVGTVPPGERLTRTFVNRRIPNGDVDGNGMTDSVDGVLILQMGANLISRDLLENADRGDVNDDGVIDSLDAALVLQFTAGFVEVLPLG
jgi:hypothetical protein